MAFPRDHQRREAAAETVFAQFLVRGVADIRWTPVDSLTAQKRLIEAGYGVSLMPEGSVLEERSVGALSAIGVDDLDVAIPVRAVVRRGGYLSPAAQSLLALLAPA